MSRVIITASGKPVIVTDDNVSDEEALASVGEERTYTPGPGPAGADYKGGFVDYMQAGAGGLIRNVGGLVPEAIGGTELENIGFRMQQRNPYVGQATGLVDAWDKGEFGQYAGYLAATQVPNLAGLGLAAGFGNLPGAIGYASTMATGDILQRQAEVSGERNYGTALGYGIPLGVMETGLGIGGTVARVAKGGMGRLGTMAAPRLGLSVGVGAGEEALQEAATVAGQRLATGEELWSPEAKNEYIESAAAGALLGGPFGVIEHMGRRPKPVEDQPGAPTDLLNDQLALPAPPLQLTGPGTGFTTPGGPTTPGGGGGFATPGQLALPAPEPTPLLTASSPFAQAAPGTQLGLPLQGGVSNQQMQLPMNMPERTAPGQQMPLPMSTPPMEAPATPNTWMEPELPMSAMGPGGGPAPPPGGAAGPLFQPPVRPTLPPVPEPQQMELPGVQPTILHNPDVARAMIGSRDRPVQSAKWLDALSDRVVGMAQTGDLRGISSEIDMRRREVEDASNRKKSPISPATTKWRMEALDRADGWLAQLRNAPPEAAPRAPAETLAPVEPEQLPLPFGSTAQPETQLGLPMYTPERPGMAATMPAMRGVGEAPAGPRGRLPEIDAWREPELPFERGYRPPTPRGEAGPLFEEPAAPAAPQRGGGAARQLSLMTKREMEAPAREKRAKARAAAQATRDRLARERAERVAAREAKAAEVAETARKKAEAALRAEVKAKTPEAKRKAQAAESPTIPGVSEETVDRLRDVAGLNLGRPVQPAAAEPAPVPPPTPQPTVEAKAPARNVKALHKLVDAAKTEADAIGKSRPLRKVAMDLEQDGVIDEGELKAFAQAQREALDHDALAKILNDHIDRWATEAKGQAQPKAEATPAPAPQPKEEKAAAPTPTRPAKAPVGAEATETVTPTGPVETAIAKVAEQPKVAKLTMGEARDFINDVMTADARLLTDGQIATIALATSQETPNFDKLRTRGKSFAGPKAAAWARIVDGVEKLQKARTEKAPARAPTKRASTGPRVPVAEKGLDYLKEFGATVLQRGAVFLRGDNIDSATAYPDSGKRAKARMRVTRLRQDRNHFASTMGLGTAQAQRLNAGVEAYLAEVPPGNSDAWTNHGWNLGHLYQYGYVMSRPDPDTVATPAPVDRDAIRAHLETYFDTLEKMQAESGIKAAAAGLAIPTNKGSRDGAAWYYERALQNRYFLDAKAQAAEAAEQARAKRAEADAATAAGKLPKRGRGRPRKDGLGPGGLAMRIELNEKQARDYSRRDFLQGISAAALLSVTNPVIAKPSVPTSTAKHPDLVALLEAGKPKEAMQWIASNSGSKHYRWLAKALMKGTGGFDSLTMRVDPYLAQTESAAGLTSVIDGRTEVRLDAGRGVDEDTFLHEMIHVYIYERWGLLNAYLPSNKQTLGDEVDRADATVKEFQDLWQKVRQGVAKNLDLETDEGLDKISAAQGEKFAIAAQQFTGSIDEALAWMLIDPKLRTYLRSVDIDGNPVDAKSNKSAWRDILNWFLRAIGADPIPDPELVTALDTMMSATSNLFASGAKVKPDLAFYAALEKEQNSEETTKLLETLNPEGGRTNMAGLAMMIGPNGSGAANIGYASLARAEAKEFEGDTPHFGSATRQETGWFKSHANGPWSFEISDHEMVIKQPHRMQVGHSGTTMLGRLIDHPQLFAAYPQLKTLKVVFDPKGRSAGGYMWMADRTAPMSDPRFNPLNRIMVSTKKAGTGHYAFPSALLHETQHAVQDLEGTIGPPPSFSQLLAKDTKAMSRLIEMAKTLAISTDKDVAAVAKELARGLNLITQGVRMAREEDSKGNPNEAAAIMAAVDDIARTDPYVKGALYDLDWTEMQARQTQERMHLTDEQRTQVNPNTSLIFDAAYPAKRLIGGAYFDQRALGERLNLKGRYPVPNAEADPETTQMRDTLGKVATSRTLSAEQRDLAAQLAPLVEDMELRSGTGELADGVRGRVTINPDGTIDAQVGHHDDVEAVLHESLHSAIVRRWGALKAKMKTGNKQVDDIVNRLEKLRKQAAKLYDAKRDAPEVGEAIENIDELLAYGRTSPKVQEWMRNRQSGGMWGSFVDTVRRIIGLSPKYGPLLNAMMRESNSLLDMAARTAPKSAEALAEKIKSGDPVQLMLRGARARVSANPINELNEMSKPWLEGMGNLATAKIPSYLAIRGDLYDMLSRRMEQAGISSDPIKKLARVIASRDAIRVRGEQEVADLNRDYLHLPEGERRGVQKGDKGKVNNLIEAMTRAGEWGFTPDWLPAADTARVKVNPDLANRFNALSPQGQAHTKALLRSIYDKTQQLRSTAAGVVRAAYAPELAAAKTEVDKTAVENRIAAETKQVLDPANFDNSLPYAPLRRSGDWAVVAMSREFAAAKQAGNHKRMAELRGDHLHYFVDYAQTEAEAEYMRRAIMKSNPAFAADAGGVATRKEANGLNEQFYGGSDMPKAFERVMARVSGSEEMKASTRNQLLNIARQLYLRSLSDQNARKGALRRFNVASMPLDIQLNVEQHLKSQSYNLASIQRNGEILDSFTALEKSLEKLATKPDDYAYASRMFNEITKRYMMTQQPPPEGPVSHFLERVRGVASFWQLSLSPRFLLQQTLQPTIMTAPLLEGRYGMARGVAALKSAYSAVDMGKLGAAWRNDDGLHTDFVAEKYRPLLNYIADMGLLDVGISSETGKLPNRLDEKIKGVRLAREWPRYVEFLNRAASAIAAYELELQTPTEVSKPDAGAYADYRANVEGPAMSERQFNSAFAAARTVQQTQGDYSTASAPRVLQSSVGATVGQYRKIAIIVASNYIRMISRMADKSLSKTERAIAARSLAYSLGHVVVFGGIAGLPGATVMFGLVNLIMGLFNDEDDPPPDIEEDIREAVGDPMLANLLLAGVPTMAGLNLSSTLGQGTVLSVQPYQDLSLQRDDLLQYMGAIAGGPAGGLGVNFATGIDEMTDGNMYKGIAKTLPSGMASALSAFSEAQAGITDKRGDPLVRADEIDAFDSILRATGLQTEERASTFKRGERAYDTRTFFKGRQDDITDEFNDAVSAGNAAARQTAIQKWMKLQKVKQDNGFKVTPLSSLLKSPARRAKAQEQVVGGVRYREGEDAFAAEQAGLYDPSMRYSDEEQAAAGGY